jgi:hypothetical protein
MKIVIVYKNPLFDSELEKPTHNVTGIYIDSFSETVRVIIEQGLSVNTIQMTMEHAQDIGFINVKALKDYVK